MYFLDRFYYSTWTWTTVVKGQTTHQNWNKTECSIFIVQKLALHKNDNTVVVGPQVWCFSLGAYVIIERFWFQKLTTHSRTHAPTHSPTHNTVHRGPADLKIEQKALKDLNEIKEKRGVSFLDPQGLYERCCAWVRGCVSAWVRGCVRGQFLKPEVFNYYISS